MKKENVYLFVLFLLTLFLDIFTKYLFESKQFFESLFIHIRYSVNYGSAFGIFSSQSYYTEFVIALSVIILLFLFKFRELFSNDNFQKLALVFLAAGIIGNLYDRVVFGFVRDFISFGNLFIFNLADLYLTTAIILLFISEFKQSFLSKKSKSNAKF